MPQLGPGEVLLKVNVASICGTDVKVLHRTLQGQPAGEFIMGHEYAGTVAALGPGVNEFQIGERVAVEVHKGCDRCENCIKGWYTSCLNYGDLAKGHRAKGLTCDGGFAEYAVNHINTLYRLPDNLTLEQACMVTTAASPLWAIDLMGGYVAGETVLVLGPGPIGLIAVQLCKALGAERVILSGTRDSRLEIGKQYGADFTINVRKENLADRVREITQGKGADSVLECAGGPTSMQEALENVKRGGRIGVVAWYTGPVADGYESRGSEQRPHLRGTRRGWNELRPLASSHERGQDRGRPDHHSSLHAGSDSRSVPDLRRADRQCVEGDHPHLRPSLKNPGSSILRRRNRRTVIGADSGLLTALALGAFAWDHAPRRTLVIGMPVTPQNCLTSASSGAKDLGYFEEEGINVDFAQFESSLQALRGGVAGGLDILGASSEPVITAISRGAKIRSIFSYAHRLTVVMAAQENIRRPADLRGKNLGIQEVGAFREVMTRAVLHSAGLTPQDVITFPCERRLIAALTANMIDRPSCTSTKRTWRGQKEASLNSLVRLGRSFQLLLFGMISTS